jgi:predicted permease
MSPLLQNIHYDIRYALRVLLKSPGFTAIIVATLALGIGANTALFSVVNGVLLNPLPYPRSAQLVAIYQKDPGMDQAPVSYLNFLDWQRASQSFSSMAIYRHEDYNLTGSAQAERVNGLMVSADFLATLGIHPSLGRDFRSEDDHIGAAPVAMLSDGFWHRRFGASPDIIGKSIDLNGTDYTITGTLPPNFKFYGVDRDIFSPIGQWNDPSFLDRRVDFSSHTIGRLKPGVSLEQAGAEMNSIAHRLALAYPEADKNVGVSVLSMKQDIVGRVQPFLIVLLAAVAFLLLIACVNVASLLLVRSMRRSGEFALRSALGAGRGRIVRQLLTESALLAGIGGALGFLLAFFGARTIINLLPSELPRSGEVSIDARVLLFTLGISLAGGIGFGLAPALRSSRVNVEQVLRRSTAGSGGARLRLQGLFVAAEIAMALVLLVGAGLMLRSLVGLWRVNPGYQPEHALTFSLSLPSNNQTTEADTRARLRRFDAAMRAIPGVEAVSVTLGSRPMIHDSELPFWIDGEPKPANYTDMHQAMFYLVESGFQPAMGINLERGRFVSPQDNENAATVVDIDDAFAHTYFPNTDPIGKHIHIAGFDVEAEIVGVVGHIRQWGPGNDARNAIEAQFYYPFMQLPSKIMRVCADGVAVVLRTHDDPAAIVGSVRRAVSEFDPGAVVYAVETMNEVLANSMAARRLSMILLAAFAGLALALSCIGLYGVLSFLAGERTREIGVRIALGAERRDIQRLILGQGVKMAFTGVALGIFLALGLTHLMSSQLFGISPHDPLTFAGVALVLLLVALGACYLPARRAMGVDPMVALRHE